MILVAIGLPVFLIAFLAKTGRWNKIITSIKKSSAEKRKIVNEHALYVKIQWFKEMVSMAGMDEMVKYEHERDIILGFARRYTTKEDWARRKMDRMIYIRMVELTNVAFS